MERLAVVTRGVGVSVAEFCVLDEARQPEEPTDAPSPLDQVRAEDLLAAIQACLHKGWLKHLSVEEVKDAALPAHFAGRLHVTMAGQALLAAIDRELAIQQAPPT